MRHRVIRVPWLAAIAIASLAVACSAGATSTPSSVPSSSPAAAASASSVATDTPDPSSTAGPSETAPPSPLVFGPMTVVAGTETFEIVGEGTSTTASGVTRARGLTLRCIDVVNDPRVSGTATDTWNYDFEGVPPSAGLDWGTRRLVNQGGAWEGLILGAILPASVGSRDEITTWLVGSGGYAGLTYYMHFGGVATPEGTTMVYPIEGIIYEGTIPMPTLAKP